jgi:ribose 5-phosphate isomerase B
MPERGLRPVEEDGGKMRIIFAADYSNECVTAVLEYLRENADLTTVDSTDQWTEQGEIVGRAVADGTHRYGVLMCWTGTGSSIAANKVPGVRAAQCWDPWIARGARLWNDANVITISLKRTAPDVAVDCLREFLAVQTPDPDEAPVIDQIRAK